MDKIELTGTEAMICEIAVKNFVNDYPNREWIADHKAFFDRLFEKLLTWKEN